MLLRLIALVTLLFFYVATIADRMWHVLHTAVHSEPHVTKVLDNQGVETFAPQFPPRPRSRTGSVRDRRSRWVFPGYLFFRVPAGFNRWDAVRWAPGVRRVLNQDGGPAMIADEFVVHLRRRLAEGQLRPVAPRFRKGDRVLIERGPLAAVDAIFDQELDSPDRVQILISMMGRPISVRIDPADLRGAAV